MIFEYCPGISKKISALVCSLYSLSTQVASHCTIVHSSERVSDDSECNDYSDVSDGTNGCDAVAFVMTLTN